MDEKLKKTLFAILLIPCLLFNIGCSYRVKNDRHQIYSKPKYGIDKFVVVQGYNLHYVEAGEGQPILLIIQTLE